MRGTKARFGIGAAGAAVAALAAVAGCSGGGSPAAATGSPTPTPTATVTDANAAALALVSAVMDKANSAGTVRIQGTVTSATTGVMTMSGQEQYSPGLKMSMTMQVQGQSLSEVLIGSTFYMDYPELTAELGGKPWGEIDLSKANGALGSLSSLANTARNYNPTTQLQAMLASGRVANFGPVTVDGQQTTHYQGKIIVAQMQNEPSALTAGQLAALKAALQAASVTSEQVDLYLSADNVPVEVKSVSQSPSGQVSTDMFLSGWGKPVQIGAPPADQVFDLTTQVAKAQASASAGAAPRG